MAEASARTELIDAIRFINIPPKLMYYLSRRGGVRADIVGLILDQMLIVAIITFWKKATNFVK